MSNLILKMSLSLDGFVCGPKGELDWIFEGPSDRTNAWTRESLSQAGAHLMGSRTFRDMAAFWPTSDEPFAAAMNELPKIVFSKKRRIETGSLSSTVEAARSWTDATVLSGDLATEIVALKQQQGKDLLAHGGARFAQSLVKTGLIDEFRLLIHPISLGTGLPLFSALEKPLHLRLVNAIELGGPVALVYRPA